MAVEGMDGWTDGCVETVDGRKKARMKRKKSGKKTKSRTLTGRFFAPKCLLFVDLLIVHAKLLYTKCIFRFILRFVYILRRLITKYLQVALQS